MAWSEWKKFGNNYHNITTNYKNNTSTKKEVTLSDNYTADSDCTLSITQIAHLVYNPSTNKYVKIGISKNGEVITPTTLFSNLFLEIANTLVECQKGDVITATCTVLASSTAYVKNAYIEFNIVE